MKKIKFTCHHCQAKLRVPTHLAGVSAPCPKCGKTITAPTDLENIVEEVKSSERRVARNASPTPASAAKVSASVSADARVSGRVIAEPQEAALPVPVPDAPEPATSEAVALPPAPPAVAAPSPPAPEPEPRYEEQVTEPQVINDPLIEEPAVQESPIENPLPHPTPEREPEIAIVEETILLPPPPPEMPAEGEAPEVFVSNVEAPVMEAPVISHPASDLSGAETLAQTAQEEEVIAEEPRAVEKTQPIQINARPSVLPPTREEGAAESGELPRLDVNLAEATEQGGSTLSGSTTGEGPTRVQLPPPGTEAHQFSPSDFIVPSSATGGANLDELAEPEVAEVPQAPIDEVATPEIPPMEAPEGPSLRLPDDVSDVPSDPEVPAPFDPQTLLRDEQDVIPTPQPIPVQVAVPPPAPEEQLNEEETPVDVPTQNEAAIQYQQSIDPTTPIGPMGAEAMPTEAEQHHDPLSEGSFESLLSGQIEPDPSAHLAQEPEATMVGGLPFEPSPPAGKSIEQTPQAALPVMESGRDIMDRGAGETDVLDDIFGTSKKEAGAPSKSMVFMLSILGAVAIIAIVLVIFIGKTLGGFSVPVADDTAEITPPPSIQDDTTEPGGASAMQEPSLDGAPSVIDPVAKTPVEDQTARPPRSTTTLPGDTSKPVLIVDSGASKNVEGLTATEAARSIPKPPVEPSESPASSETAALSFDERIQQIVNGEQPAAGSDGNYSGPAGGADSVTGAINDFSNGLIDGDSPSTMATDLVDGLAGSLTEGVAGAGAAAIAAVEEAAKPLKAANYNPPASFDAPDSTDDSPLGKTHDLLDAFLRAPDWETRIKYIFEGESLRPSIEEYYKQWPMTTYDRFSLQLFQMEQDKELGGPYWVYQVSTSDLDQGFPVIIRVEDGKLKVDWEIFSEFQDQHFVKFQEGAIASPHTFRVVIERVSDYYGSDRDGFENLDDYFVYQVSPPYGDLNEFSDYAFVKSDSELAQRLDNVVGLNDEPLAVIITLEQKAFPHGVKHLSVTDYVTEGWFR